MSVQKNIDELKKTLEEALLRYDEKAAKKAFNELWDSFVVKEQTPSSFRALFETYLAMTEENNTAYLSELKGLKKGIRALTKRRVSHEEDQAKKRAKKIIDEV